MIDTEFQYDYWIYTNVYVRLYAPVPWKMQKMENDPQNELIVIIV